MALALASLTLLVGVTACGDDTSESRPVATPERSTAGRDDEPAQPPTVTGDRGSTVEPAPAPAPTTTTPARQPPAPVTSDPVNGPAALERSFARLEQALGGRSGISWLPIGSDAEPTTLGQLTSGVAWSTSKVPIAMAVIRAGATGTDLGDIDAALQSSDNAAALRLWDRLGGGAAASARATEELRAAGDQTTVVESRAILSGFTPFGQTRWSAADQATFMAGITCTPEGETVLGVMAGVSVAQRWGLGRIGPAPHFKGGWGPATEPGQSSGYLNRQMGIVTVDGRDYAVAILTVPASGTHESGMANLDRIAAWFQSNVPAAPAAQAPTCGHLG